MKFRSNASPRRSPRFERTITSGGRSRFDQFVTGKNRERISDAAVRGLHLFRTDARCVNCHHGPNFTDDKFHDLGLSYYGRKLHEDLGRYHVTQARGGRRASSGRHRCATSARTEPYMHNGLFDLDGVLNMYNNGMPTLRRRPAQAQRPAVPDEVAAAARRCT